MNFRQRLDEGKGVAGLTPDCFEIADGDQSRYFGIGRGYTPICLELRFADGSREAFPYATFIELGFSTLAGIEILTSKKRILIVGRTLISLYDRLLTYRVKYVQTHQGLDTCEEGLFVASILVESLDLA